MEALARSLRVLRYQQATCDLAQHGAALATGGACERECRHFQEALQALCSASDGSRSDFSPTALEMALESTERSCCCAEGIPPGGRRGRTDGYPRDGKTGCSRAASRRAAEQLVKAQRHLLSLEVPDHRALDEDGLDALGNWKPRQRPGTFPISPLNPIRPGQGLRESRSWLPEAEPLVQPCQQKLQLRCGQGLLKR